MYKRKCLVCWKDRRMLRRWKSSRTMCLIKLAFCSLTTVIQNILEHEFVSSRGRQEHSEHFYWRQLGSRDDEKGKFLMSCSSLDAADPGLILILQMWNPFKVVGCFVMPLREHTCWNILHWGTSQGCDVRAQLGFWSCGLISSGFGLIKNITM